MINDENLKVYASTESVAVAARELIARGIDPRAVLVRLLVEATLTHARLEEQYPGIMPSIDELIAQAKAMLDVLHVLRAHAEDEKLEA